jgi:hypothetical protein
MHEILGSISPRYAHSFFGFSEYESVRTYRYILVNVLKLQVQASTYSVGTVPQWYILRYSTKPLVLVCSSTYLLVMHVTILRISTVPNQNVEILRIMTCITRRYVLLQTSTNGFV